MLTSNYLRLVGRSASNQKGGQEELRTGLPIKAGLPGVSTIGLARTAFALWVESWTE